jgi:SAM-dependent methyltransferase
MPIHVYTRFRNDAATLADVLTWYMRWADRVIAYDEGSSDGSGQLARDVAGVVVEPWQGERRRFHDEVWQQSRGQADWVVLVEADEIVWSDDPAEALRRCRQRGVTVVVPWGFEMLGVTGDPSKRSRLWERIRLGAYRIERSRPAIFDPAAIESMGYDDEGLKASPRGRVHLDTSGALKLLRYRFIGQGNALRKVAESERAGLQQQLQKLKEDAVQVIGAEADVEKSVEPGDGQASYESMPYRTYSRPSTRVEWLATLGQQFGLRVAPPRACRVLEIGCGNGANILAQAALYPQSRFVGFDLSQAHIEQANLCRAEMALSNIAFERASITDFKAADSFDYIICHGVYSWIDATTQQALLALMRRLLAPAGLGFLSYNIFPGWKFRQVMRDAMLLAARHASEPAVQVREAKAMIRRIIEVGKVRNQAAPYATVLQNLLDKMSPEESYAYHEFLELHNEPVYFEQMAARLRDSGLQYVTEAQAEGYRQELLFPRPIRVWLDQVAQDSVERQQYLDFLLNRGFRESLVCRAEAPLDPLAGPEAMRSCWFSARNAPAEAPPAVVDGRSRCASDPLWYDIAQQLPHDEWEYRHFDDIAKQVQASGVALAHKLFEAFEHGLVRVVASAPPWSTQVPARPRTTAWVRWQAEHDTLTTNLSHQSMTLDPGSRQLLALLDGTRTVDELAGAMARPPETITQALQLLAQARLLLRD